MPFQPGNRANPGGRPKEKAFADAVRVAVNRVDETDPEKRKIVSGILAIAGVALTLISTALQQGAADAAPEVLTKARAQNKAGVEVIEKISKSHSLEKALAALKY